MRKVGGVAVLLAAAHLGSAAAEPGLADCAAQLAREGAELARACPEVDVAIASSPFAGVALPGGQPSKVDIEAFDRLTSAFAQPRASRALDPRRLDGILAGLEVEEEPKSLWQLFADWLRERGQEFAQWLPDLPNPLGGLELGWNSELARSAAWGIIAMLVAIAVVALFALWRAVRRRGRQQQAPGSRRRESQRPAVLADLDHGPPARRVRLLLLWVLGELRRTGRLMEHAALTHRQLVGATRDLSAAEQQALGRVAVLAERVTYSRFEPAEAEVGAIVAQGRQLVRAVAP